MLRSHTSKLCEIKTNKLKVGRIVDFVLRSIIPKKDSQIRNILIFFFIIFIQIK